MFIFLVWYVCFGLIWCLFHTLCLPYVCDMFIDAIIEMRDRRVGKGTILMVINGGVGAIFFPIVKIYSIVDEFIRAKLGIRASIETKIINLIIDTISTQDYNKILELADSLQKTTKYRK